MQHAFKLAEKAKSIGEVPVGAVIVSEHDDLIGEGYNQCIRLSDPTAHAEIIAIREASQHLKNYRITNAKLYVTLEPCAMCAGAILESRIKQLYFATRDIKEGACGSKYNVLASHVQIDEGIMQTECAHMLSNFFKELRER